MLDVRTLHAIASALLGAETMEGSAEGLPEDFVTLSLLDTALACCNGACWGDCGGT